jgi:hypothetical protein
MISAHISSSSQHCGTLVHTHITHTSPTHTCAHTCDIAHTRTSMTYVRHTHTHTHVVCVNTHMTRITHMSTTSISHITRACCAPPYKHTQIHITTLPKQRSTPFEGAWKRLYLVLLSLQGFGSVCGGVMLKCVYTCGCVLVCVHVCLICIVCV